MCDVAFVYVEAESSGYGRYGKKPGVAVFVDVDGRTFNGVGYA